jgi:hypothetical protein
MKKNKSSFEDITRFQREFQMERIGLRAESPIKDASIHDPTPPQQ